MTLALLLTAVTGAWATDVYVVGNGNGNWLNGVGWDPGVADNKMTEQNGVYSITFTNVDANPESPFQFMFAINGTWDVTYGCISDTENELNKTLSNIDATGGMNFMFGLTEAADVTISFNLSEMTYMISTKGMKVGDDAASGPEVAWDKAKKTGTFTMPAFDVVLTPIYAKAAAFATTGTEPEVKTLLPEAAEGVIADTDAPLIVEGTVAFAGQSTEVKQGTVMYAVTPATVTEAPALDAANKWSADVPTAKLVADGGVDVLVWYYIKGADTPQGQTATAENTFNDSEICAEPIKVTVLTNKFDIQFNAANANTIEAGKATVTVGGTAATVTEGKLESVKMGSEVKIKAKEGYKFRKVEVKKAGPAADIVWDGTNVTDLNVESTYASYTKEGVKLSGNADEVQVKWNNSEYLGKSGMEFITMESGGFTFTAPTGKAFTKIEMKAQGSSGWATENLGTGWAYNTGTVTWNGSAASTVKLLKDADMFSGDFISSIAFYLSE